MQYFDLLNMRPREKQDWVNVLLYFKKLHYFSKQSFTKIKKASHFREAFHWLTKPWHFNYKHQTTQLNTALLKNSLQIYTVFNNPQINSLFLTNFSIAY